MKRKYIILFILPLSLLLLSFSPAIGAAASAQGADPAMGFIGAETCKDCHEKQYESYAKSVHFKKSIKGPASQDACETCHGPGAKHVEKGGGRGVDIFTFDKNVDAAKNQQNVSPAMRELLAWTCGKWVPISATTCPAIPAMTFMSVADRSPTNLKSASAVTKTSRLRQTSGRIIRYLRGKLNARPAILHTAA